MVFDRFKKWRKEETAGIECPLCQQKNPVDAESCSTCQYQLQKAAHQQDAIIAEADAGNLFDELLADFDNDNDEEIIDWSKMTFEIDDVTIDIQQYDDDDGVTIKGNPIFSMTVDHPEPVDGEEEEYELKPEDAPEFVTKFEIPEEELINLIRENFNLRPYGIVKMLDLLRPIYQATAAYGHFGRDDIDVTWEQIDKVEQLRDASSI